MYINQGVGSMYKTWLKESTTECAEADIDIVVCERQALAYSFSLRLAPASPSLRANNNNNNHITTGARPRAGGSVAGVAARFHATVKRSNGVTEVNRNSGGSIGVTEVLQSNRGFFG